MTDIRDIYSTREAYNHKVKDVQEPFIAELLLSLIISLTILSGILFLRWFVDTIEISMYAQFVTLILPAVLTFIRRKYPKLLKTHLASGLLLLLYIDAYSGNGIRRKQVQQILSWRDTCRVYAFFCTPQIKTEDESRRFTVYCASGMHPSAALSVLHFDRKLRTYK